MEKPSYCRPHPLLIQGAALLPSADGPALPAPADILIESGRIARIAPDLTRDVAPDTRILPAHGLLAIPGLINAHLHSSGNFMRGTLDGLPLEVFMLYEVPPLADGAEDPRTVYLRTLIGAVEMLKLGITSVLDDAFFVPLTSTPAIDAILSAYRDSGMRATVALDQPLVVEHEKHPFLAELLPADIRRQMEMAPRETEAGMRDHYAHLISRWHGAADGRLRAAVSCSAPQRATASYLEHLAALSETHDLAFFCHILETRVQRVLGDVKYGRSLVRLAADAGILSPRTEVIHAIWIDDQDIELLAASGCTVAHNPVCNLRLGSGIMPFRRLRDAGVPIAIGTDEAVSDDSHDVWGSLKLAGMIHSLASADYRHWPTAREVLEALWSGGARAMRQQHEVGVLEPGAAADIALLDLDDNAFLPLHDLPRQLVFANAGRAVRHTIVAGEIVVRDGRVTTLDEASIRAELRAMEPRLRESVAALRRSASRLEPYYRDMYLRSRAVPLDGFSPLGR